MNTPQTTSMRTLLLQKKGKAKDIYKPVVTKQGRHYQVQVLPLLS